MTEILFDEITQFNWPEQTRQHITLSRCQRCGAAVFDQQQHIRFHQDVAFQGFMPILAGLPGGAL